MGFPKKSFGKFIFGAENRFPKEILWEIYFRSRKWVSQRNPLGNSFSEPKMGFPKKSFGRFIFGAENRFPKEILWDDGVPAAAEAATADPVPIMTWSRLRLSQRNPLGNLFSEPKMGFPKKSFGKFIFGAENRFPKEILWEIYFRSRK